MHGGRDPYWRLTTLPLIGRRGVENYFEHLLVFMCVCVSSCVEKFSIQSEVGGSFGKA